MFFTSVDDIYLMILLHFILIFYCKIQEAQMFQCRGPLFVGKPHEAQMLWC